MRQQVRRSTARVLDAGLSMLGEHGLQTYVSGIKRTTRGSLRQLLLALPAHAHSTLTIHADPVDFLYLSTPQDDLNIACRDDFRSWEPRTRALFGRLAGSSACILDVGAYSGIYAVTAALSNTEAEVWAFEPNPPMLEQAAANVRINGVQSRVQLMPWALSDSEGARQLFARGLSGATSMASLMEGSTEELVTVSTRTLDSLPCAARVDLIKIDVEGSEELVIRGGLNCLASRRPTIVMEALTDQLLAAQRALLSSVGYAEPMPISTVSDGRGDDRNYVWVAPERAAEVAGILAGTAHL